jgi:hypothetical protein
MCVSSFVRLLRGAPVADTQRAGFTDLDLLASGFGHELWGHDGRLLVIMRSDKASWNKLKWGSAGAATAGAVEGWDGVKQAGGGLVVELHLVGQDLAGAWWQMPTKRQLRPTSGGWADAMKHVYCNTATH